MVLRLVAASLLVTVTAYAQAPGELTDPGAGPGGTAPVLVSTPAAPNIMANRWAVGLSIGSLSLAQRDTGDSKTQFNIGELSFRVRATWHLEVELALGGGAQQLQDGSQGELQVSTAALNLRYRFRPNARWNWWLMGGVGVLSVTEQGATAQDRQDSQRPLEQFGIGIERRWSQFALHAELAAIGVGPMRAEPAAAQPMTTAASTIGPGTSMPTTSQSSDNLAGGALTIGASYYF